MHEVPQTIVELMREDVHDVPWLERAVQAAIELELATIPPYLCARWSILDSGRALDNVRSIVRDEMGHMGSMCNLLKALGVNPRIVSVAPKYPGPLPGGVRPDLVVYLSGMNRESVRAVYMEIEKPETPLALLREESYTSIGKFYEAVADALVREQPALSTSGQLTAPFGVDVLATIPEALRALDRIRMQGEGTSVSPYFDGVLAHYYKFAEIHHGRELREGPPGKFTFSGAEVPFPRTLPMARVPEGGWPNRDPDGQGTLARVNGLYRQVLEKLESAWATGNQALLDESVGTMLSMSSPARKLMRVALPDGEGSYGPDFIL